eukprot:gnl/TRDRNA2_/TRDRNA2_202552_c0_seq1.p1 gnl/TRDRNA2_/TRDRNA2_202552_c0~~gnl/TRDRNA2_/TRDRNA2_202552_c0_seq1.p1  ORF type:complete len:134 (-),score=27.45 gnl/TRDRNA2_/TRDRNA2_202552_c0_seq1:426-827(-)
MATATEEAAAPVMTKEALRERSIKELKTLLKDEGYNPDEVSGIEKEELVEKLFVLLQNPRSLEDDEFPLPLGSNCWPQLILRALLLAGTQVFTLSYWISFWQNAFMLFCTIVALSIRNVLIRRTKAVHRRKRL